MSHEVMSTRRDGSREGKGLQADTVISGLAYQFGDSGGLHCFLGTQEKVQLG